MQKKIFILNIKMSTAGKIFPFFFTRCTKHNFLTARINHKNFKSSLSYRKCKDLQLLSTHFPTFDVNFVPKNKNLCEKVQILKVISTWFFTGQKDTKNFCIFYSILIRSIDLCKKFKKPVRDMVHQTHNKANYTPVKKHKSLKKPLLHAL